jgi:hypothetical protein
LLRKLIASIVLATASLNAGIASAGPIEEHPFPVGPAVPGDCNSYFTMAMEVGFTWLDWPEVAAIGSGESTCGINKKNIGCTYYPRLGKTICEHSLGWGQINVRGTLFTNPIGYGESRSLKELCELNDRSDLLDDLVNLTCMYRLEMVYREWDGRLWHPWGGPGRH